ncbi:MAG: hypothetical protein OWR62_15625 [Sulfobacillus thermotolerans]|uniref:Histidine kinase N-terminal 7TM region domain-containing protein n=1 Tax=Sulfobacillus thermotolerans TaxID=338644 RepID=A0ABN5H1V4_9FIRM|nr:hypothetical protein BXT84_12830 [Sulfobacillus thermotolerans]MCY0909806.1 hypothetical protein [Sulfobacillus thermotolerans]
MTAGLFVLAALLALIFAGALVKRYQTHHAPFYLWWTISFGLYTLAYLAEALTVNSHWNLPVYDVYIVASAGLVGSMSVGTAFLAFKKGLAKAYAWFVSLLGIALIIATIATPPAIHGSWLALNGGKGGIIGLTQLFYVLMASLGGTIVVLGALWSWWKTRRYYNLLIAAGALIASTGGTMASQGVGLSILPVMNIVGLVLIFLGYIYSRSSAQGRLSRPMAKGA